MVSKEKDPWEQVREDLDCSPWALIIVPLLLLMSFLVGLVVAGWMCPEVPMGVDVETLGTSHFDAIDARGSIYDGGGALQLDDTAIDVGDVSGAGNSTLIELDDSDQTITVTVDTLYAAGVDDFFHQQSVQYNEGGDYAVTAALSGAVFTNRYATDADTFTLPAAAEGLSYCFYVYAAFDVYVDPATGDQILALTDSAGDRINSSTVGDAVCLVAQDGTYWLAISTVGTWSDAN